MKKNLLDELRQASHSHEPALVCFFNNGEVMKEDKLQKDQINSFAQAYFLDGLNYIFKTGTESLASRCIFDSVVMKLKVGLVYNIEDVDTEDHIKENAKPLKGIVRCYTDGISSYLNGEKSNGEYDFTIGRQGFVDYEKLVSAMKENKVEFIGPETFEEFKKLILSGEKFDISVFANLKENTKEDDQKKLNKKPFFRKQR